MECTNCYSSVRKVTAKDLEKYDAMINKTIYDIVVKPWRQQGFLDWDSEEEIGRTGLSIMDLKSIFKMTVYEALIKFDENKGAKESTYVFLCLKTKALTFIKKYAHKKRGYGITYVNYDLENLQ